MEPNFIPIPNFTAPPSPPSPFIPVFQAPPSPPSPFIPVPKFQAPPSPPSPFIPAFHVPPSPPPPSTLIPDFYAPPSPPSPYLSTPSPPKAHLPKPKNSNSPKSGTLMITGAIVIFFFLLWVGVTLYRRHQRRRRQRSQQGGGDGPKENAEALQEPAVVQLVDLPLTSRNRRWETQMQLEEHEERPLASGRNQVEIQIVDDLPPAPAFSQHPPSPCAQPLPEHLSEQVLPAPPRNEPRRPQLVE